MWYLQTISGPCYKSRRNEVHLVWVYLWWDLHKSSCRKWGKKTLNNEGKMRHCRKSSGFAVWGGGLWFWWPTTLHKSEEVSEFPLVPHLWVEVLDQISVWLSSTYYEPEKLLDDPHDFYCASCHHVSLSSVCKCVLRLWGRGRRAQIRYSSTGFSCWRSCYIISVSTIYLACVSVSPPFFPDPNRYRYVHMWTPLHSLEYINFSKQGIVLILSSWHQKEQNEGEARRRWLYGIRGGKGLSCM